MTLKNGKFYDEYGNVVPLEFGNKEQIAILTRVEKMSIDGEEAEDYPIFNFFGSVIGLSWRWNCLCGRLMNAKSKADMNGRKYKCPDCKARYILVTDEDWGGYLVKLRK